MSVLGMVQEMLQAGDRGALDDLLAVFGTEAPGDVELSENAALVAALIHDTCGKGDPYAAERTALSDLAATFEIDGSQFSQVEALEDEIATAMTTQLREKLSEMSDKEREKFFEDMLRRMSDEDRVSLMDQVLKGFDDMDPSQQEDFIRDLAAELDVDGHELRDAIAGGTATLLPLLLAKQTGFSIFLWTTSVMKVAASSVGLTLPIGAYIGKNWALGRLLGPWGLIASTALSIGWFGGRAWRRRERFRRLAQLVLYMSAWRERRGSGSGGT